MLYYLAFCLVVAIYEIYALWNHPYPQSFAFKAQRFALAFVFAPFVLFCYIVAFAKTRWG